MFELKYKDMFAGEIYLEMTYFINVSRRSIRRLRRAQFNLLRTPRQSLKKYQSL